MPRKALTRTVGEPNPDRKSRRWRPRFSRAVNNLGIGSQGFGGTKTALAVHMETFPVHLAIMPVASMCNATLRAIRRPFFKKGECNMSE